MVQSCNKSIENAIKDFDKWKNQGTGGVNSGGLMGSLLSSFKPENLAQNNVIEVDSDNISSDNQETGLKPVVNNNLDLYDIHEKLDL